MARKTFKRPIADIVQDALTFVLMLTPRVLPNWSVSYSDKMQGHTALTITVTRLGTKGDGGTVDLYAAIKKSFAEWGVKNPFSLHCNTIYTWEPSLVSPETFPTLSRKLARERRTKHRPDG